MHMKTFVFALVLCGTPLLVHGLSLSLGWSNDAGVVPNGTVCDQLIVRDLDHDRSLVFTDLKPSCTMWCDAYPVATSPDRHEVTLTTPSAWLCADPVTFHVRATCLDQSGHIFMDALWSNTDTTPCIDLLYPAVDRTIEDDLVEAFLLYVCLPLTAVYLLGLCARRRSGGC